MYKLVNIKTGQEIICDKIQIENFEYYVSDEKPKLKDVVITAVGNIHYINEDSKDFIEHVSKLGKKVIATNNQNIDIPKVVNEIEKLAFDYHEQVKRNYYSTGQKAQLPKSNKEFQAMGDGFIDGYNKSQEMFPFTEEDMIEFAEWCQNQYFYSTVEKKWSTEFKIYDGVLYTTKELLKIWKEQQPKTIYYE